VSIPTAAAGCTTSDHFIRSDPHGTRTDSEILYALQRSSLLPPSGTTDPVAEDKFRLDALVNDEGALGAILL
jgi:hypothetical protein